ncbi:hypothetical protein D018_4964A, partial [Vibrio parahaemolyticus VP2007-007]
MKKSWALSSQFVQKMSEFTCARP